jgi:membrane-associated protein
MRYLEQIFNLVMHLDQHLKEVLAYFGPWCYVVMFLIIFCETGLVVTPILPGDSLLFALGTFAANGSLDLTLLLVLLPIAAILGDSVNYWLGMWIGPRIFRGENVRFLNRKHLDKTHEFYERYGGKTIILARFIPIVRTFAPFVAGMGRMTYRRFMAYNVVGGVVWIFLFVLGGYFWGSIPWVKNNFTVVMLGIVFVSVLPAAIEFGREWLRQRRATRNLTI